MKKVIILSGIPGSGKSTLAKYLAHGFNEHEGAVCRIVSADGFFTKNDKYEFDVTKIGEAHADCFARYLDDLRLGDVIIVDNTCCTIAEIAPYELAARAFGYDCEIHRIDPGPKGLEICLGRNIHNVPLETMAFLYVNWKKLKTEMPPWWKVYEIGPIIRSLNM